MNIGIDSASENTSIVFKRPTTLEILEPLGSGVGLDLAQEHSGVTIYKDGIIQRHGFKLDGDFNKSSNIHALYDMRKDMKIKLKELLGGLNVDYLIIEDVYAGENYKTVEKLITLQTVIDELLDEGVLTVKNFYRWKEPTWIKNLRRIRKIHGKPTAKFETQQILEYINDDFYMKNKDLSKKEKELSFFEDICDSTAMLLGLAMFIASNDENEVKERVSIRNIKMYYLNYFGDYLGVDDDRIRLEESIEVDSKFYDLEQKIIDEVTAHPNSVLFMYLPVSRLGAFGIKHKLPFHEDGEGVLFFYKRK